MTATFDEINELLDALYLELLHLIEEQTACRVNIEKLSKGGQLLLAKTRYVQGSNTISIAQIPTENGSEFEALCRINTEIDKTMVSAEKFVLKKQNVDKENGFVEPMNWFGALPPTSLRMASEQFKKCLELVVESANIQKEMLAVMNSIEDLKTILAVKIE